MGYGVAKTHHVIFWVRHKVGSLEQVHADTIKVVVIDSIHTQQTLEALHFNEQIHSLGFGIVRNMERHNDIDHGQDVSERFVGVRIGTINDTGVVFLSDLPSE